jgi:N6-L-threonylcarbamoyladenine synthase
MLILGIESSCDETAASVVKDGRTVLSNIVASQVEEHRLYGGVVPEIASRRHCEAISGVVKEALEQASCSVYDLDAIAVTYAPGLIGALLVGVNFAKGLAYASGKPLVPVHHLRGHIASNYISNGWFQPPFLCLVVSGGHTHLVEVKEYTKLKILGRTHDDAAGEAFDKAARNMGMPYPGGIMLDRVAETGNDSAFRFPRPAVEGAPLDFSFSGLKTSVINTIHNARQKGEEINVPDLSASFRKAVVGYLMHNLELAQEKTGYVKIATAGGVSANSLLRREIEKAADERDWILSEPNPEYCGDNAAMIASQGYYEFITGNVADMTLNACAQRSIDQG